VRPFRFGFQLQTDDPAELRRQSNDAQSVGFDVLCSWDHLGEHFSALAPLVAAAQWTDTIRLCPLVVNNDFHHPALLAQELATLDRLSSGRLEVGIGAGHAFTEYRAAGIDFDPPAVRKARLAKSVEILRQLLDGDTVSFAGEHYQLDGVKVLSPHQEHVPIFVGVNGRGPLAHAALHADTIGLTLLGRTLADGQRHAVRWEPERLDATVAWIAQHAAARSGPLELNALVQAVVVTDDRVGAGEHLAAAVTGLSVSDALSTPFLALGTRDDIAAHLLMCRERWGISYFVFREIESVAPVIDRLRRADSQHR
jgi:probable F420-dependent oxidoreductase